VSEKKKRTNIYRQEGKVLFEIRVGKNKHYLFSSSSSKVNEDLNSRESSKILKQFGFFGTA